MEKISIIGLGYVGIQLAVAFAEKCKTSQIIGFDINKSKIKKYKKGIDITNEVGNEKIKNVENILFTYNEKDMEESDFFIITVPTPVNDKNNPDLTATIEATEIVGENLKKGSVVVYESTFYPGLTEEICIPLLEKISNMKCPIDFKVGYSPERINPGDELHKLKNTSKIISGVDYDTVDKLKELYKIIIESDIIPVSDIKTAEACKILENAQRDINIAFINEMSIIFDKIGINTNEVLDACNTKWNFLNFRPGLVGGHCISVDPYYLIYKANKMNISTPITKIAREVNENMSNFVLEKIIQYLKSVNKNIENSSVLIYGLTFKENTNDIRNSKVINIIKELQKLKIKVSVIDENVSIKDVENMYNIKFEKFNNQNKFDTIIFAVAHKQYEKIDINKLSGIIKYPEKVIFDLKGVFRNKKYINKDIKVYSL